MGSCSAWYILTTILLSTTSATVVEHFIYIEGIRHVVRLGETFTKEDGDSACKQHYGGLLFSWHNVNQITELGMIFLDVRPDNPIWIRGRTAVTGVRIPAHIYHLRSDYPAECAAMLFNSVTEVTDIYGYTCDTLHEIVCTAVEDAVSGWSCIEGQCNPDGTAEDLAPTAQTYGPKDCFEQCDLDENCTSVETSVSSENQTCNMHTEHCPTGYPRLNSPEDAARRVCSKGPILPNRNRHYTSLAVLSDGNDTTCVNAATVSPSMEYLILHFPWPSWDWSALTSFTTEIRFKVVMDIGLECEADYSELPWYEQNEEVSVKPEIYVYMRDKSYDPLPVDFPTNAFQRCRVYQRETEVDAVRVCFFKCTCLDAQCHSAFLFVPDKTFEVCELSVVT